MLEPENSTKKGALKGGCSLTCKAGAMQEHNKGCFCWAWFCKVFCESKQIAVAAFSLFSFVRAALSLGL